MASIYDKASLVMIPSGTKTSKLYSQKPVNGDGDFTFSRSTAATRVNADGLIEKETQNLVPYSNTFSSWNTTSMLSPTTGHTGYDGSSDAWKIIPNTSNTSHRVWYPSLGLGYGVYTISIYAKAAGYSTMYVYQNSTGADYASWFDLSTGSVGSGTGRIDTSITDVGSGWYRCTLTGVEDLSHIEIYVGDGTESISFAGDGTSGILIQDAQLEQGMVARDYIETTTTAVEGGITDNVPRLDYTDASCPSLLLEPQRTNLFTNSEYITGFSTSNTGITIEENSVASPQGVINAAKIKEDANNAAHAVRQLTGPTLTSGTDYTFSFFAKKGERSIVALSNTIGSSNDVNCFFDLENGQVLTNQFNSASIEDFGNGWYRCIATDTADANDDYDTRIYTATADNQFSHQGVLGSGLYIFGLQLEAGSYATSYIPTYGSAVTRNVDTGYNSSAASVIGQGEGTIYIETIPLDDTTSYTERLIQFESSGSDFMTFQRYANGNITFYGTDGTNAWIIQALNVFSGGTTTKIAGAYKVNDVALYVNGVSKGTDTTIPTMPNCDRVWFANNASGSLLYIGKHTKVMFFPTRLSNEELADLTTL